MLVFVRSLIRQHPSSDVLSLALREADKKVPLTEQQRESFVKAVTSEAQQSPWPQGFFP
jgi:hypothetical protein